MQDIISTLKNALQQAEAGLEVAVGRLAKDGTERGDFKPSEVLALACVREALAMPVTCLHQIQEPAAAEQAAWHAGLDEGRAQAAPAAVGVSMAEVWELSAADTEQQTTGSGQDYNQGVAEGLRICAKDLRAALAATSASSNELGSSHEYAKANGLMWTPFGMINRDASKAGQIRTSDLPGIYAAPKHIETSDAAIKELMGLVEALGQAFKECGICAGRGDPDEEKEYQEAIELYRKIESKLRALLATATGLPAQAVETLDFPSGAILNGRAYAERLDTYGFECEAGALSLCSDWQEFRRCFEFLAEWASLHAPQAQADARDAEQEKPPAGRYVLAWMEGREIPIRAMWVPKSWLVAGDECPEGWAEYDEEKDEYYCPEGWYEANEHEETHWHVSTPIVAWVELPRRAAIAAAKGEGQ